MSEFTVIGLDSAAVDYLESGEDVCFGKWFAKTTTECRSCRAPVIRDGRVILMRDMCQIRTQGLSGPVQLVRLTSKQVLERLERGDPFCRIFGEIMGGAPPHAAATAARQVMLDRFIYLRSVGMEIGKVPRTKELVRELKEDR